VQSKEFLMSSNRLAIAALALACIASAAAGGYLATRQNTVPTPAAAMTTTPTAPAAETPAATPAGAPVAAVPERPVQETEAVVSEPAKKSTAATAKQTVVSKRAEPPANAARQTVGATPATARRDQPPPLTSTWPASASSQPPAGPAPPSTEPASSPRADEARVVAQDPQRAPEPPKPTFEDLVIARDSVIGLQTENRISSETARVEDRVDARVTRDVRVGDRVAVPAGARAIGSVSLVERGGKFKERARLGIRFHTLVLADGTRVPINTETIYRDGDAPTNSSAQKVGGGAIGGAIIGAIIGGGKGAAIGAAAGAGAGSAAVVAGGRQEAVLAPGTALTARINQPVTVTVEKE
jgi:type IV secretory pathway VirB10-like protein